MNDALLIALLPLAGILLTALLNHWHLRKQDDTLHTVYIQTNSNLKKALAEIVELKAAIEAMQPEENESTS